MVNKQSVKELQRIRDIERLNGKYGISLDSLTSLLDYLSIEQIDGILGVIEKAAGKDKAEAYTALPGAFDALKKAGLDSQKIAELLSWTAEEMQRDARDAYLEIAEDEDLVSFFQNTQNLDKQTWLVERWKKFSKYVIKKYKDGLPLSRAR